MQCEIQDGQQTGQPSAEPSTEPSFEPSAEPSTEEPSGEEPSSENQVIFLKSIQHLKKERGGCGYVSIQMNILDIDTYSSI